MIPSKELLRRGLVLFHSISLILFETLVFIFVWYTYFYRSIPLPFWRRGNFLLFLLYGVIFYVFTRFFGGNRLGFNRISDIIYQNILTVISVNIFYYLQISLIARAFRPIQSFIVMSLVQIVFVFIWAIFGTYLYTRLFPPRKMLMIAGHESSVDLKSKMDISAHEFDIQEIVNIEQGLDHIKARILQNQDIIIADVQSLYRNEILKFCYRHYKRVFMTPKLSDIIIRGSENIHLFDTPLLLANNKGLKFEQRMMKRLVDVVGALMGLILLMPLYAIIALVIKIYDGGPVLYTQPRLTMHGKVFNIYKFRSMKVESEQEGVARLAQKDDDRITPVGRILRNTHFDELPQLINILLGDMSIVGPRPERPDIAEEYVEVIPEFSYRLKVKAGLTGYAQVYGKYSTTPYDKLKHDLFYIENYSLWKDINIILLTAKIMFQKEKSEGVERSQINALKQFRKDDLHG